MKLTTEIPGITIRAFGLSEALIKCNVTMSYSDAKDLCKRSKSGLIRNKELRDVLFDLLTKQLEDVITEKEGKVKNG